MAEAISIPNNSILQKPSQPNRHILLADDDTDDCVLFKEALRELRSDALFTTVCNGELLMQMLYRSERLPDLLFLDLNMPRKNGFECLSEIKRDKKLRKLPVIILSTSFGSYTADILFKTGAQHLIRKPNGFEKLTEVIRRAIQLNQVHPDGQTKNSGPVPEDLFVLSQ